MSDLLLGDRDERLARYVSELVDQAPPLTAAQRNELCQIIRGGQTPGAA